MARQRFIHPDIWTDPTLGQLTPVERLFFIGCFSNADDEGRLLGNAAFLRATIFPYDEISIEEIQAMRDRVVSICKNLVLYEIEGIEYLAFAKWTEYQKPKYPKPSKLPPPPNTVTKLPERWYIPKDIQEIVLEQHGNRCALCGTTENIQVERVIPLKEGGTSSEENLQVICTTCKATCKEGRSEETEPKTEDTFSELGETSPILENRSPKLGKGSPKLGKALPPGLGRDGLGMDRDGLGMGEPPDQPPAQPDPPNDSDITLTERTILHELKSVPGYPFEYKKDLDYIRILLTDYPGIDIVDEAKKWSIYKRDRPLTKKSNPRLQFRNWLEVEKERGANNGRSNPHRQGPPGAKYDDLVIRDPTGP